MRVVIADDSILIRDGIASLLRSAGVDVLAQSADPHTLLRDVDAHAPDVAIVDIRMPPTHTDEGLRAAIEIRARHPETGILILSQHVETGIGARLLIENPAGIGYLLKDRAIDLGDFVATLTRVAAGGSALDPQIVSCLLARDHHDGPLVSLSEREHEVLGLVAEGRSNRGIAVRLTVSERAVQKHITSIFGKLRLRAGDDDNRRILAALTYLEPGRQNGRLNPRPGA
jgi:DNA-binding NarL/FixJ family response regulator